MRIIFAQTGTPEHTVHFLKSVEGNEIWQITDEEGQACPGCEVFRYPRGDDGFVLWRAKAYSAFNKPGLYCDDDMIFQKSFEPLAYLDFDVCLTRRDVRIVTPDGVCITDSQPYNGGFAFVRNHNYWPHIVMKIEEMGKQEHMWYGDQLAMAKLVNVYKTMLLPCSIYNYTPNEHKDMQKDMSDKWMIHFKGSRKPWMKEYAERIGQ
jgi:lipopolysaccharide biosynthesis glycosyltransferase